MMKRFALRLLAFCLVPLPFLYGINYMVDTGLKRSHSYYYSEWNDIFNSKITGDMLIIGSSRAWVHISTKILDSVLKVNSYNLGLDASHFLMQQNRFKLYLKYNKKPRYVIVSVDFTSFTEAKDIPFPEQFLPYLGDADINRMTEGFDNSFSFAQRYFPLFKYNNQPDIFWDGISAYFGQVKTSTDLKYKGYLGIDKKWDGSFDGYKKNNPSGEKVVVSAASKAEFLNFIKYCTANHIKPILVFTPVLHESLKYVLNGSELLNFYAATATSNHIPFLNYAQDPLGLQRAYFYNSQHLNKAGSEVFSGKLANDLKRIISK